MTFAIQILLSITIIGAACGSTGVEDRISRQPTLSPTAKPTQSQGLDTDVPTPALTGSEPTQSATAEPRKAGGIVTPEPSIRATVEPTQTLATEAPSDMPSDVPSAAPTLVFATDEPTFVNSMTETTTECDGRTETLQTCFADELDGGSDCDRCIASILQGLDVAGGSVSCDVYETDLCDALATCPCGACVDDLQDFLNCNIGPSLGCVLSCLEPSPAPVATTSEPTSAATTPAPTSCSASTDTLQTCFSEELNGSSDCDQCLATVLQDIGAVGSNPFELSCSEYENRVCNAINNCSCGSCADAAQTFMNCNVGPNVGCLLSCFEQPSATANCLVDPVDIAICFASESSEPTCGGCLQSFAGDLSSVAGINISDIMAGGMGNLSDAFADELEAIGPDFNCTLYQESVCGVLSSCDCGTCFQDVGTLLDCYVGNATGCYLTCDSGATDAPSAAAIATEAPFAAPSCAQIEADAITCLATGNYSDCDSCVATSIPTDTTECSAIEDGVCSAIAGCPCSDCSTVVEQYLSCTYESQVGCAIAC